MSRRDHADRARSHILDAIRELEVTIEGADFGVPRPLTTAIAALHWACSMIWSVFPADEPWPPKPGKEPL